jgi:hypothetical protein
VSFRVQATKSISAGDYKIRWETDGDDGRFPIYAPLEDLVLKVSADKKASISVATIPALPEGSTSIPIQISTKNAPVDGLTVSVAVKDSITGVTVSKKDH